MILPLVAELLSRVGRHPAVEASLDDLRRGSGESSLAGLTDPAKGLVTAICAASLVRPVFLVVASNRRGKSSSSRFDIFLKLLRARRAAAWLFFLRMTSCLTKADPRTLKFPRSVLTRCGALRPARQISLWRR